MNSPSSAYPMDSYMVRGAKEVRTAVNRQIDEGVSAIKAYFRISLDLIKEVCKTAHAKGIPVTAHLEITDVREAILAGLDGIEHITSLGIALSSGCRPKNTGSMYSQIMNIEGMVGIKHGIKSILKVKLWIH